MSGIDYTKHKDKRVNNPTMENRGFFVEEERKPYNALYPRDPSLDPQLVWKGKDEQDREDLAVPTVPIYIQEKVLPAAIIDELRSSDARRAKSDGEDRGQLDLDLFADFNGIESFDKEVEFYQHEKHWSNRMILGDSLLVMNSLVEKERLRGKVQCIYMDPPYGIKFGSNWQVSTRKRDVKDGKAEDVAREPEVVRAFRDTWKLGIHSYLSYLRDRFRVAQELLTETGSIFVQIGDENLHLVRCILDEVFGSENLISTVKFYKTTSQTSEFLPSTTDFLLWYGKDRDQTRYRSLFTRKNLKDAIASGYAYVELESGERRPLSASESRDPSALPKGARVYALDNLTSQSGGESTQFEYEFNGQKFRPTSGGWKTNLMGMKALNQVNRLGIRGSRLRFARFFDDFPVSPRSDTWIDLSTGGFVSEEKVYVVQTNAEVIARCILMSTDPGDLVIDPTCGSGTTAFVAEQWGRRWITMDTSRVSLALARTRLMTGRFPYYLLADSEDGIKKEADITGQIPPKHPTAGDIKKGFVYERVPHVTLKSIANNPDIREGMTREEIDKAILKHADTEFLFDKPYADNKRIRVTGPFTVESLSPHRTLPSDDDRPVGEGDGQGGDTGSDFVAMVLDNLRKAGVQNTKKGERLKFDDLQPAAGPWIQATGIYTDGAGNVKRVAVSVGPEYGPITPVQVKGAAKEAVKGAGHDLLVICGYARDPHSSEESKQYGALPILLTRINEDLRMGDDMLKKTGAGNLFMVFGEPDLKVTTAGGKVTVEIQGLDVYDPTTGEIRSDTVDDIACWFIDTNYNEESFFVRQVYFVGAEVTDKKDGQKYDPYRALRATLRAEIDEEAWASIYSAKSRPFDVPETGKIAVKVINHYGDEVLKVYEIKGE